jgi:hypothetical protein
MLMTMVMIMVMIVIMIVASGMTVSSCMTVGTCPSFVVRVLAAFMSRDSVMCGNAEGHKTHSK